MTVSTTTLRAAFSGNGSTTVFAYNFKIFADTELTVIVRTTATGAESVRAIGTGSTNYAVSGVGVTSGGNVTFVTAPTSAETVVILRSTGLSQGTDYQPATAFPALSHEDALDKLTHITQELDEELSRSFKVSRSVTDLTTPEFTDAAATRASKVLGFDSTGANLEATQELGEFRGNWAASTAYALRDIIKDTSNNNIYICVTVHTSSGSQPISSNTDAAKWSLIVDAASATTSAAASATSATASASSATAAASSATAGASSATAAASSASTASTQASNASTSATAAAASNTAAANSVSAVGLQFTFDDSTTMADPGVGDWRFNHGTISSVSAIALDATSADTGNPDVSDFITTWDDSTSTLNGHLILKKKGTPATFAIYTVGAVTDNTGWLQVALTHVDSAGSWSAADVGYLQFIRIGDKGDTGSTGATGAKGDAPGLLMAFETTQTDTDQGAGKVWLNAAAGSATVVYMDDVEAGGASINTQVDSWDDSTNTALRGTITIMKNSAPQNFHIFNVTGAVTSASTYSKVAATFVQSAGTISDGDAVSVQFVRTGNKGADGSGSMSSFTMSDGSTTQAISDGQTQVFAAGEGLDVAVTATDTVTYSAEDASVTNKGVVELATDAETITGTDTARAVTPANLQAKVASATAKGIVELATDAEAVTGSDTARATTAANVTARLAAPGAIGGTTAAAASFTTVSATGNITLGDAATINMSVPLLAGADHTFTGLSAQMLAGGTIAAFDLVCVHTTTQEVVEADASAYATARVIGIAPAAISDTATGTVLLQGFIRDDSWSWTAGSTLYLSETAGAMTHTAPSTDGAFVAVVGVAISPDVVYMNPSMTVIERA